MDRQHLLRLGLFVAFVAGVILLIANLNVRNQQPVTTTEEPPPPASGTPIDETTVQAWKRAGLELKPAESLADGSLPTFGWGQGGVAVDLTNLPAVRVPFALDLSHNSRVTDKGLRHLAGQENLTFLDLSHTKVTDEGMEFLAGLKQLKRLSLRGTDVSDAGLKHLTGLEQLTWISLTETRVIGTGLRPFAGRKSLTIYVASRGAHVTDEKLKALADNEMLYLLTRTSSWVKDHPTRDEDVSGLHLEGAPVTDAGLQYLARLANLKSLTLNETKVTGEGLKHLAGLQHLNRVDLHKADTTAEGLKQLATLKHLTSLNLDGSQVTDTVLEALAESGRLHALSQAGGEGKNPTNAAEIVSLDLAKSKVTPAAVKHLALLQHLETLHLNEALATAAVWQHFPKIKNLATHYEFKWPSDAQLQVLVTAGFFPTRPKSESTYGHRYWTKCDPKEVKHADLRGAKITGEGLQHLAACENLSALTLASSTITELHHLKWLPKLTSLDLSGTPVTGLDVQYLADLKSLTTLNLYGTRLTGLGVMHFADLKSLTTLDVSSAELTDTGLMYLAGLTRLTHLKVSYNPVTDAGVEKFQKALPNCKFIR